MTEPKNEISLPWKRHNETALDSSAAIVLERNTP